MRKLNVEQGSPEWHEARRGKITGSRLKDLVSVRGGRKLDFYQLVAERITEYAEEPDGMDRGNRLEDEAIGAFEALTGKLVERVGLCISDTNEDIAVSPDGLISNKGKYTEAVEVKCLSTARYLKAFFEQEIPAEYFLQVVQYFIVIEDLETLYFTFYDPRVTQKPMFFIPVTREEVATNVAKYLAFENENLEEIKSLINQLTF